MPILRKNFKSLKIGFSTFAFLQSKFCMPVGGVGGAELHNACVCTKHQNLKLTLNTINTFNYKDVLKLCISNTENSDCMLHHCDSCPEQAVVQNFQRNNCS